MVELSPEITSHFWTIAGTGLAAMIGASAKILWDRHASRKKEKKEKEIEISEKILKLQENQKVMNADQENIKIMLHEMRIENRELFKSLNERIDNCLMLEK